MHQPSHTSCKASECQNSFFSIIRTQIAPEGWGNGEIWVVHVTDNISLYLLQMLSKSAIAFRMNTPFLKYKNRKHFDVEEQFGYFHIPSQKNVPGFHKSRSSFMVRMFSVGMVLRLHSHLDLRRKLLCTKLLWTFMEHQHLHLWLGWTQKAKHLLIWNALL